MIYFLTTVHVTYTEHTGCPWLHRLHSQQHIVEMWEAFYNILAMYATYPQADWWDSFL